MIIFSICFVLYVKKDIYNKLIFNIVCIKSIEKEFKESMYKDPYLASIFLRGVLVPLTIFLSIYSYLIFSALYSDILVTICVFIGLFIKSFFSKKIEYRTDNIVENMNILYSNSKLNYFVIGILALNNALELMKITL